jgi:hypothetical protein
VLTAAGAALVVAGAGTAWLVSRRDPPPVPTAASPVAFAAVTLHGREGTFGSLTGTTPSGQPVAHAAVPGWDFAPGVQVHRSALAADGTVLMAGAAHNTDFSAATADRTTVAAYRPEERAFATVQIGPVGHGAPSVVGLAPVDGGVAFVLRPARGDRLSRWPAFGVLTTVEGRWRAAPVRGAVTGDDFTGLAMLPRSRHILVARDRGLLALRLSGPGVDGGFTVEVAGEYAYPRVADGRVSVREVRVDPTGRDRDERFAIGLDVARGTGFPHQLVQELQYDAATGRIGPVSAPFVAGDRNEQETAFYEHSALLYDHAGNLWVSRTVGFHGGPLAVYTADGGRRRMERGECRLRPGRPLDRYRAEAGGASVWGQACRPDYDIHQGVRFPAITGLAQDPATKDVVALGFGGSVLAVRAVPSGGGLAFRVGNAVDLGRKLLPVVPKGLALHHIGAVDGAHRVWITGTQALPHQAGRHLDQWLYSVDLTDLFDPAPVRLPDTPGRSVTIQAERSATVATTTRPREGGGQVVYSDATVQDCTAWANGTSCGYDGTPGDGYHLADPSGYGRLRGTVDYRVEVPAAGAYRVSYRAATFPVIKGARIALSAGGRTYVQAVSTDGHWRTVPGAAPVELPAGTQTIRLSIPKGGEGWFLNAFTLQRV